MAEKAAPKDFHDLYDLVEQVGQGGFASVFRCVKKETKEEYAVKVLRSDDSSFPTVKRELDICRVLNHTHVVKLVDYHNKNNIGQTIHYLVFNMEWGGELLADIVERKTYSEYDACHCIEQILKGVDYLHKNNIVHRDLQSKNVLLTNKHKDAVIKIADFGSADILLPNEKFKYWGAEKGFYMAPEMISGEICVHTVDVWACGVLLYIMLIGRPPFSGDAQSLLLQMTSRNYWLPEDGGDRSLCKHSKDLIGLLLNPEAESRISAEKALRHTFIRQRKDVASRFHRQKTVEELTTYCAAIKAKWKSAVKSITRFMKLKKRDRHHSKGDVVEHAGEQIPNPIAESDIACGTSRDLLQPDTTDESGVGDLVSHPSPDAATVYHSARADSVMAQIAGMTLSLSSPSSGITNPRRRFAPNLAYLGRPKAWDDWTESSIETSLEDHTSAGIESLPSFYVPSPDELQTDDDFDKSEEPEPVAANEENERPREFHSGWI